MRKKKYRFSIVYCDDSGAHVDLYESFKEAHSVYRRLCVDQKARFVYLNKFDRHGKTQLIKRISK